MRFCDRVKVRREELNLSQEELAKRMGYKSRSTINKIELGINDVSQTKIVALAKALDTTIGYLMGDNDSTETDILKYGLRPIKTHRVPVIGEIACGEPIFAEEQYGDYVDCDIQADYALTCRGDSMINARIRNGDLVFIRAQKEVENGEIAAVIIDDEATLKRVYYYPEQSKLILQAENPAFEPLVFVGAELENIRILGKAVAFQSII